MGSNPYIDFSSSSQKKTSWRFHAPLVAIALWLLLWANLDTGFWDIVPPDSFAALVSAIRGSLPFFVLPISAFILIQKRSLALPRSAPSRLLLIYGILATISGVFSPEPLWAAYWSVVYLATILAAWTFVDRGSPVESARTMLLITWCFTFIIAAYLGHSSSNMIFSHPVSAYNRPEAGLDKLSRASGVARWAAIPGLVCLVRAFYSRHLVSIAAFVASSCLCFFIVYRMQSRGAVFGSVAAIVFVLIFSSRMRRYALPFVILSTVFLFLIESPGVVSENFFDYLRRGQSEELFSSLSGRTRAYDHAILAFSDSPFFGRGQWTDRLVIYEHVHNSFLQSLLNAGIIGGIPYFASWIAGWIMFFRLRNKWKWLSRPDRLCVLESGAVMMFFTVRAIPETTTASFAVDLLVMVAVYVYIEALTLDVARRQAASLLHSGLMVSNWSADSQPPQLAQAFIQR